MLKKKVLFMTLMIVILESAVQAQYNKSDTTFKRCFVGSTLFLLGNLSQTNNPEFAQLNLGYRLNGRSNVSLELKTWKYAWPLGIPYGDQFEGPTEGFPGSIKEKGFALAYQKYFYKNFYAAVHVMNAWQSFRDADGKEIDKGFQIFNTYRLGYHFKLFKDRFFIEPSIAITHRPYHTEMPERFKLMDDKWPKFFFGEPGLHFGFNF